MQRIFAVVLLCVGIFCLTQANAQTSLTLVGVGTAGGGAAGYTGPADCSGCNTNVVMWVGLRALSAAKRGTRAVNACHSTAGVDDGCADLNTDATTGILTAAVVDGTHTCPGAGCNIKRWYDQTGLTNCSGGTVACDLLQATPADRAALTANVIGTLPGAVFGTNIDYDLAAGFGQFSNSQPFSMESVMSCDGANTTPISSGVLVECNGTPGFQLFAGSNSTVIPAANGTVFGNNDVLNGASSLLSLNGAAGTLASGPGAGGMNSIRLGDTTYVGKMFEFGVISTANTAGQNTAVNTNQQAFWGF